MNQYVSHPHKTLFNVGIFGYDVCLNCIQYSTIDKQVYYSNNSTYSSDQSLL